MAWLAVSGIFTQYHKLGDTFGTDSYIKFYSSQTNNPINMATDNTGATQLARAKIDASGFIVTDAGSPFIPHVEEDYNLLIYQNAADADANVNPVKSFTNISNALSELATTNTNVATNTTNIATNAANIQDNKDTIATLVADTDAATLNGQNAAFYQNADNINAGTLNAARLPTTGIQASTLGGALQDDAFFRNATNINAGTLDSARLPAGEGGGIDADLFRGSDSDFYRNASNLAFGTVPLARLPQGAGAGMDSDLLDGQQGSYYLNLDNATNQIATSQVEDNAITEPKIADLTIIDGNISNSANINGSKLLANSVSQTQLKTSSVGQAELKTTTVENSGGISPALNTGGAILFNIGSGEYTFFPSIKLSNNAVCFPHCTTEVPGDISCNPTGFSAITAYTQIFGVGSRSGATGFVKVRYATASPPYQLDMIDFPLFVSVVTDKNGDIKQVSTAEDPIWSMMLNKPVGYDEDGDALEYDDSPLEEARKYKTTDTARYFEMVAEHKKNRKIKKRTIKDKNRLINHFPHPFLSKDPEHNVSILAADQDQFCKLVDFREAGESINELLHDGFIELGEAVDMKEKPAGVEVRRFKFKNTK